MERTIYLVSESVDSLNAAFEEATSESQRFFLSKGAALDCADDLLEWNGNNQVVVIALQVKATDVCSIHAVDVSTEEGDSQILMNQYEWREAKAVF